METEYSIIRNIILRKPIFEFNDKIDYEVYREILKKVDQIISQIFPANLMVKKRSFFVCRELIENASRHSVQKNDIHLALNTSENKLLYICENVIHNDEIPKLQNEIEELNNADEKQLKSFYKKKLSTGRLGMGSAGLGLIDLHRKTKNKLLINFTGIDEKYSLFSIISSINIEQ